MSFPILQQYEIAFPDSAALLQSFPNLYTKKYLRFNLDYGINLPSHHCNSFTIQRSRAKLPSHSTLILSNASRKISIKLTCLKSSGRVLPLFLVHLPLMQIRKSYNFYQLSRRKLPVRMPK